MGPISGCCTLWERCLVSCSASRCCCCFSLRAGIIIGSLLLVATSGAATGLLIFGRQQHWFEQYPFLFVVYACDVGLFVFAAFLGLLAIKSACQKNAAFMLQLARALSFLVLALPWLGGFSAYVFDEQVCNDLARKEQSYSSTYSASGGGNQSGTYTANITTVPLYCYDTVSKTWTQNILDSCWRNHTPWDVAKVPLADSYCLPNIRSCRLSGPARGRSSALRVLHSRSVLHGSFLRARRAVHAPSGVY